MVRLRPVRLIKYVIKLQYPGPTPTDMPKDELAKRKNALRIFRKAYVNGSWGSGDGQLIAENVKTLQFRRSTVTDKAVSFELSKQELKKGGE